MFQNTFQNGNFFELYDPKISQDKLKNLYRLSNVHTNNKIFDKQLKTYVLQFSNSTSKMCLPREEKKDLYLIQQFLIFQIYFFPGMSWNIELVISDLTKTKRRIMISSTSHKLEIKPFFIKFPCPVIEQGVWNNLSFDLFTFINAFKGQTYRSLDAIYLTGHFKLRRIYTTNTRPTNSGGDNQIEDAKLVNFLPKNFYYPPGIEYSSKLICYEENLLVEHIYQPTQPSTKNGSQLKSRLKVETPANNTMKSQKTLGYKKEKKFLANTNGTQVMNRKKKRYLDSSQKSQQTQKIIKTPMSTQKNVKNRKSIGKTYLGKKQRTSIEKKKEKAEEKKKINPWRGGKDTDASQFSISKPDNERNIESAQTTMFKTKNNLAKFNESKNKGFGGKSDHYSDSEYIELSQKFSTVTDGKMFKNELGSQQIHEKRENQHDEIQQNIEMETNSMYSTANKKNENYLKNQLIQQSIVDSLNYLEKGKSNTKKSMHEMAMSSHYGFGERIMNKFIGQIQRPYSPPIGRQQLTEEPSEFNDNSIEKEVEVIYDPVLNCYYDHRTHTYYELKN